MYNNQWEKFRAPSVPRIPVLIDSNSTALRYELLDPDVRLMLKVRDGNAAAYEELVLRHQDRLHHVLENLVRDHELAKDLAQEVFLRVFKARERYDPRAKFSTWLYTIARNLCLNEIRRRSRHPADSLDATHPDNEDQPHRQYEDTKNALPPDLVLRDELTQKVEEALADLPENQKTAILLFQEEELAYEDIAKILGCSLSATKSLIHRGRETLKQRLKPYLRSGAWRETKKT